MLLHAEVPAECCDCTVWCRVRFHLVLMENGEEEWAAPKDAARKGKDRHPSEGEWYRLEQDQREGQRATARHPTKRTAKPDAHSDAGLTKPDREFTHGTVCKCTGYLGQWVTWLSSTGDAQAVRRQLINPSGVRRREASGSSEVALRSGRGTRFATAVTQGGGGPNRNPAASAGDRQIS